MMVTMAASLKALIIPNPPPPTCLLGYTVFMSVPQRWFLYARLKNGTYYVTGYGVRPSVRKLFRFRLTPPTVYIQSS